MPFCFCFWASGQLRNREASSSNSPSSLLSWFSCFCGEFEVPFAHATFLGSVLLGAQSWAGWIFFLAEKSECPHCKKVVFFLGGGRSPCRAECFSSLDEKGRSLFWFLVYELQNKGHGLVILMLFPTTKDPFAGVIPMRVHSYFFPLLFLVKLDSILMFIPLTRMIFPFCSVLFLLSSAVLSY